jgi:ATP-dependent DNA ligase
MKYDSYKYLFPPRPEQTTQNTELGKYDNGLYIAQPKYNGTCCNVFLSEKDLIVMNRHKRTITSDYSNIDLRGMHRGNGWMVICGEFLNKNKKGEDGNPFNLKFVIWDILVYDNEYMIGSKLEDRLYLLEELYPCSGMAVNSEKIESYNHLCCTKQKNVYKAPSYIDKFESLYQSIVDTDLYEGVVLKRKDARLCYGLTEKNNNQWQIKCRKPTKSYNF